MIQSDLLTTIRTVLADVNEPYLWSDDALVLYANEGINNLCEELHLLVDTQEELALYAGEDTYELDAAIRFVYRVTLDGTPDPLGASVDCWTPSDSDPARPMRYTTDTESGAIRFWPQPDTNYTAVMRVARLPAPLMVNKVDAEIEIPIQYLPAVVDWVSYRCLIHQDIDGSNPKAAESALLRYERTLSRYRLRHSRFRLGSATRVGGNRIK